MTEFTQAGKEMANRIFTNQGPRYGLGIERLCNELGELRARVEALEDAQRPTVKDSLTVPADSLAGRRPWAAMAYRGVMLLPPIDCIDADLWIADRIYEMGLADGKNATTGNTAPVTRDRAEDAPASSDSLMERVADAIRLGMVWTGDGFSEEARAAIREVAAWLRQRKARVRASVEIAGDLEREINQ